MNVVLPLMPHCASFEGLWVHFLIIGLISRLSRITSSQKTAANLSYFFKKVFGANFGVMTCLKAVTLCQKKIPTGPF